MQTPLRRDTTTPPKTATIAAHTANDPTTDGVDK
jgi:hypothetical protein